MSSTSRADLARTAGHDLVVVGLFLVGEVDVAVVAFAFEHGADAGAADAFLARDLDLDADGLQRGDDRLAFFHPYRLAAGLGHHLEAGTAGIDVGVEVLAVNAGRGQAGLLAGGDDPFHEARGTAGVEVGARGARGGQDGCELQLRGLAGIVEMQRHLVCEGCCGQLVDKGAAGGRAGAVMQLERPAGGLQGMGHGDHRRDADAAAHQHAVLRVGCQRKVVARRADRECGAFAQPVEDGRRAAARGGVAQHAQAVAPGIGRVAAQGVLAH